MSVNSASLHPPSRRAFLKDGVLMLAAASAGGRVAFAEDNESSLKFAVLTDLHYADKSPNGSRHYRDTPDKLAEATIDIVSQEPDFVVELGDLIDAAPSVETELSYLRFINERFSVLCKQRHYVLGNHCVDTLTKAEFLNEVGQEKSYYSFDSGDFHFVVLDACFRGDGEPYGRRNFKWTDTNIPQSEIDWLKSDLAATKKKTIVFGHQRLDVADSHGIKNAPVVRAVLEDSEKVLAVFQGHSHANDLKDINGIHYCTMVAMIEGAKGKSNGYSIVNVATDGTIRISGFHKQASYEWPTA